jgi:uroporphyrinogen III methyltransferase/synthase
MIKSEKPLAGLKVLVTRAQGQSENFKQLLQPLGAEVSEIPVIEISQPDDFAELDKALGNISQYDWLVFVSKNAVNYTLARAQTLGVAIDKEPKLKLAAIGPATADELTKNGLGVDFCPSSFVAEFLVEEFPNYPNLQGTKVFWPRTNIGRTLIADQLTAAGATVDTAIAYKTGLPSQHLDLARQLVDRLASGKIDVITLASAQSARNLAQLISMGLSLNVEQSGPSPALKDLLASVKIAAIGPVTAMACREVLGKADIEAAEYTLGGLTEALLASLKFGQKEQ